MPEEVQGQQGAVEQGQQGVAAEPLQQQPQPQQQPAAAAEAQQPQPFSVRDTLRGYGFDVGDQDEREVLARLAGTYREAEQLREYANYGREYARHADEFRDFLRSRQEAAARQQQQQQQQESWWKAPEYDPSWAAKITRDPATGELRVAAGADPSILPKFHAWAEHQRSFLDRLCQDPVAAIRPGVEQVAREVAERLVQEQLGGYREQSAARELLEQNAAWMQTADPATGRPVLTEWGQRYAGYARQAVSAGVQSVKAQHDYALGLVQRDYLAARFAGAGQAQQSQAAGQEAKNDFLARAAGGGHRPQVGAGGAVGPNGAAASPPAGTTIRDLQEVMLRNMRAAGFQPGQLVDTGR